MRSKIPLFLAVIVIGGILYFTQEDSQLPKVYFEDIKPGMTYEEVINKVERPFQDVGSGVYILVYQLNDGGKATFFLI